MTENTITINITGSEDVTGLFATVSKAAKSEGEKIQKSFGDKLAGVGKQADAMGNKLTLGLTTPLMALGAVSVDAASDLEESMSKVNVVFGRSADEIQAWSQTSATSVGLARQEALEAAGTFGNLFTSMGLGQETAADLSVDIVQLAADLGSFNNVDPSDMLLKLRSGLVGEVEPLRAVGINLNAAAVEAKALEMGLADANGELSEGAKVQARYALIVEQSSNAIGDFARTSDGLANSQRIAEAEFKNTLAILGQQLLPIVTGAVGMVTDLVQAFNGLPEPVQATVVQLGLMAAAAGPALKLVGGLASGVGGMMTAAQAAGGGLKGLSAALNTTNVQLLAVGGAIIAVVAAFKKWQGVQEQVKKGVEETDDAWDGFFQRQIEGGASTTEVLEAYREKQMQVKQALDDGGVAVDLLVRNQRELYTETGKLNIALAQASGSYEEYQMAAQAAGISEAGVFSAATFARVSEGRSQVSDLVNKMMAYADTTRRQAQEAESADAVMLRYAATTGDLAGAASVAAGGIEQEAAAQAAAAAAAEAHTVALLSQAEALSDAGPQALARAAISGLQDQLKEGKLSAGEYEDAVRRVQDRFGLVTPEGRALADGLSSLNSLYASGAIDGEKYDSMLLQLRTDAKDGKIDMEALSEGVGTTTGSLNEAEGAAGGASQGLRDLGTSAGEARGELDQLTSKPWVIEVEWDVPPMPSMPTPSARGAGMQHGGSGVIEGPAMFYVEPGVKEAYWFSGDLRGKGGGMRQTNYNFGRDTYNQFHVNDREAMGVYLEEQRQKERRALMGLM